MADRKHHIAGERTPGPPCPTARGRRGLWGCVGLLAITFAAYLPAMGGGFIWDDDSYIQRNVPLRTLEGLGQIWTNPSATPQYYPLVHSSFWIEYHLWGDNALGFHVVNVLLHALGAILLWRLLRRLEVRAAYLAALLFAVHPVAVESVAWITERKNVLSGVFYLLAATAYLWFAFPGQQPLGPSGPQAQTAATPRRPWKFYAFALFLFVCSLLSKTVTATLPVALLLVLWWKRPRLHWRDVWPLAPMLLIGAVMGLLTARLEVQHVGASGQEWNFAFADRVLIAGQNLWFYLGKLFWPAKLTFIYPRWRIHEGPRYLYPLAYVAMLAGLFVARRKIGKGPLVAMLFFAVTLFPALGFFNVFPFLYSFVADHWQYHAMIGVIALAAGLAGGLYARLGARWRKPAFATAGVVVATLAALTFLQARIYRDTDTLWADTLAKNPSCWMAHINLGNLYTQRQEGERAIAQYRQALALHCTQPDVIHFDIANLHLAMGDAPAAIEEYRQAIHLNDRFAAAYVNLGQALLNEGQVDGAIACYRQALAINPALAAAEDNLGLALMRQGRREEAIDAFAQAANIDPAFAKAQLHGGMALAEARRYPEARQRLQQSLHLAQRSGDAATASQAASELGRMP